MRRYLQEMIENLKFEDLPPNWNSFDLVSFSKDKKLWDYQQEAVKNAIKVLWKYFEDFEDYKENESLEANDKRKEKLYEWYKLNGLDEDLDIKLDKTKGEIRDLLTEYYTEEDGKIHYKNFINRMSFWMATGSGKSLVIIKLIQILLKLMEIKEIPPCDILILTHRDNLIEQLKKHIDEFNSYNEVKINLRELRDYPDIKRVNLFPLTTVFYYRSDNLSNEQKEKIIDFKNYNGSNNWYVFLDEAHKGDKEESKRQHIYSILSKNGFLFNSSATFTDQRDIITCVYDFNLSKFIQSGYGKHICILKQEIREFKNNEDYTDEEKQKIVLKSLILLTYIKKIYDKLIYECNEKLYHKPLMLTLVNSVNTEEADLKLFFREIEKIGKNDIEDEVFEKAKNELWEELKEEPSFVYEEDKKIKIEEDILKNIKKEDIIKYVYNSEKGGEIEIIKGQKNKKELALKLKTSDKPFALIKIGDISSWLKEDLGGYEIQNRFEDESYFENLNKDESEINILMGSRSFYEGWDSNRPNLINFINIGVGEEAKKFIVQSVGRGVRIEPIKNKRKRLLEIFNANEIDKNLFNKIKDLILPLETLFIFGTNRTVLKNVIENLEIKKEHEETQISLNLNPKIENLELLIPVYKFANYPIFKLNGNYKFEISENDFNLVKNFCEYLDDRILLVKYNTDPNKVKYLREQIDKKDKFKFTDKDYKNVDLILQRFFDFLSLVPQELDSFKKLENEIKHFKNIKVSFKYVDSLKSKINAVFNYKDPKKLEETFEFNNREIIIKNILNHYYLPLIMTDDEKLDYIKHIIKTRSEIEFIDKLEKYLDNPSNKFNNFDWWAFSKIDESIDEIYIPYFNPNLSKFYPDFIFWFKKNNNYCIIFVDPKGTEHTQGYRKIDGYKKIFEENNKEKIFKHNDLNIRVKLFLYTDNMNKVLSEYKNYWFDDLNTLFDDLFTQINI